MDPILDKQAFLDFQEGKHTAFKKVLKHYYPVMLDFANRLVESSDEAEDIAMVAFRKLFGISANFSSEQNVKAFLYITVRNNCISYLRQKKPTIDHSKLTNIAERGALLSHQLEVKDILYRKVMTAINNLPEECGKIFKMLYIDDLTPNEVAEILRISTSTVYTQRTKALKSIKLSLGDNPLALGLILPMIIAAQKELLKFHHAAL